MVFFQDWIGSFFHLYFLHRLWNGFQALNQLQKITTTQPGVVLDFPKDMGAPWSFKAACIKTPLQCDEAFFTVEKMPANRISCGLRVKQPVDKLRAAALSPK